MEPKAKNAVTEKYYGTIMREAWPEFVRQAAHRGLSLRDVRYEAYNANVYSEGDRGELCLSISDSPILYQLDAGNLKDPTARSEEVEKFLALADLPRENPPHLGFRALKFDQRFNPTTKDLVSKAMPDLISALGSGRQRAAIEWTSLNGNGQEGARLTITDRDEESIHAADSFTAEELTQPSRLRRRFGTLWDRLLSEISRVKLKSLNESLAIEGGR